MDEKKLKKIYLLSLLIVFIVSIITIVLKLDIIAIPFIIFIIVFNVYGSYNAIPKAKRFVPLAFVGYGLLILPLILIIIIWVINLTEWFIYFLVVFLVGIFLEGTIRSYLKGFYMNQRERLIKDIEELEQKQKGTILEDSTLSNQVRKLKEQLQQGVKITDEFIILINPTMCFVR